MAVTEVILKKKDNKHLKYKKPVILNKEIKSNKILKKNCGTTMKSKKEKVLYHGKFISHKKYQKIGKKSSLFKTVLINSLIIVGTIMIIVMVAVIL